MIARGVVGDAAGDPFREGAGVEIKPGDTAFWFDFLVDENA